MEKYEYSLTDSTNSESTIKILQPVSGIDSANFIFRQIMGTDLGGIAYDKAVPLSWSCVSEGT